MTEEGDKAAAAAALSTSRSNTSVTAFEEPATPVQPGTSGAEIGGGGTAACIISLLCCSLAGENKSQTGTFDCRCDGIGGLERTSSGASVSSEGRAPGPRVQRTVRWESESLQGLHAQSV